MFGSCRNGYLIKIMQNDEVKAALLTLEEKTIGGLRNLARQFGWTLGRNVQPF